jgi:hypothetical protein
VALAWMIAGDGQVAVQDRSRKVDRAVAEAYAALARREAGRLNREGDFDGARQRLALTAGRIQRYASDDAFLNALVKQLEQDGSEYCARMTSADRKARYMGTYGTLKSRGRMGGSTRSPRPPDTDDPGRGTSGSGT